MKKILAWFLLLSIFFGACALAEGSLREAPPETPGSDVPKPLPAPSKEAFAEKYFSTLASVEAGSAGASLKTALAAEKVCAFAVEYELWNPDVEALRANMLSGFESLDADTQAAAQAGFDTVLTLLDDCLKDWEANRPLFADAGLAEKMDAVMYDPLNRLAWENLRDHTLTMGNDPAAGEEAEEVSFEQLAGLAWCFSSGAGAWSTEMQIEADGSFKGVFHDSEMGDAEEAYPNGTVYTCVFSGQMSFADANALSIRIDRLTPAEQPGQESIEDGVRYIASEPYGLSEGDIMRLYLPGTPAETLTEDMRMWAHLFELDEMPDELKDYFLYSEQNQSGFIGIPPMEPETETP